MGKVIVLVISTVIAAIIVVSWWNRKPEWEPPPGGQEEWDRLGPQAQADYDGELGIKARAYCSKLLEIEIPAKTAMDLVDKYGKEKAVDWMLCVVNTMYPDTDKK